MDRLPCRECNSRNIIIGDYGYSSFNYFFGECKDCGFKVTELTGCMPSKEDLIFQWNSFNTPEALLVSKLLSISKELKESQITLGEAYARLKKLVEKQWEAKLQD